MPWKVDLKDFYPQPAPLVQVEGKDTETPAPWWKKVGRYFVRNHKWLIATIVGFIGTIVGPIIVFIVQKKLGD